MNVNKITSRYGRALGITPVIAGFVAMITLFINLIIPAFVGIFDEVAANRLRESVELTSVYGVALGTILVFMVIASMFAINLPLRIQQYLERQS
jgi:predicted PurR-regulated permease PerM